MILYTPAGLTEAVLAEADNSALKTFFAHFFNTDRSFALVTTQVTGSQVTRKERNETQSEPVVPLENVWATETATSVTIVALLQQWNHLLRCLLSSNETSRTTNNNNRNATVSHSQNISSVIQERQF